MDQKIPAPDPESEPPSHLNPLHRGTREGFTPPEIESDFRGRPRMVCAGLRLGLWTIRHGSCANSAATPQIQCLSWFRTAPETSPPRRADCAQREPCRSVTNERFGPTYPSSGTSCPGHVPRNQPLPIRPGNSCCPDTESGRFRTNVIPYDVGFERACGASYAPVFGGLSPFSSHPC